MENQNNPRFIYNPYAELPWTANPNYITQPNEPDMIPNPNSSHQNMMENPFYKPPESEAVYHNFQREHPQRERRLRNREPLKGGKSVPDPPNKSRSGKQSGSGSCSNVDWRKNTDPHYK